MNAKQKRAEGKEKPRKAPPVLYHYCGVEAFQGIIESKKLWLSNVYTMNDHLEIRWSNNIIEKCMNSLINSENKDFFQKMMSQFYLDNPDYYIFCLSSDGDTLSQWRAYSEDATGFSIGINTDALAQLKIKPEVPHTNISPSDSLGIFPLIYDPAIQEAAIRRVIARYLSEFRSSSEDSTVNAVLECASYLRRMSPVMKNPKFSEEMEWRIVYVPFITIDKHNDVKTFNPISEIGFRTRGSELLPYFELDFAECADDFIIDVKKGPKNQVKEPFLKMLLSKNGYRKYRVSKSDASYR